MSEDLLRVILKLYIEEEVARQVKEAVAKEFEKNIKKLEEIWPSAVLSKNEVKTTEPSNQPYVFLGDTYEYWENVNKYKWEPSEVLLVNSVDRVFKVRTDIHADRLIVGESARQASMYEVVKKFHSLFPDLPLGWELE